MSIQSNSQATSHISNVDLRKISVGILAAFHEWRTRAAMRRTLADATDRQLRDAGLIRQDLEDACDLPFAHSAEAAIRAAARGRAMNW